MDDITWKTKLAQRNQTRHSQDLVTFIIIFSLLLGGWAWYFFIYTRTPDYALQQVQSAIKNHDRETFRKFVNADLLTSVAYDDLTVDLFSYDQTLTPSTKALFEKFYVLVKPTITKGMLSAFDSYIETGNWQEPEAVSLLKGQQLGIDFDEFLERSQLRNTSFREITDIKKDGKTATALIAIQEDYTQADFTLQVQLEADENGHWQIAYLKNYQEFLQTVGQLQNKDVAVYIAVTQKIVSDYNNLFLQQQVKFKNLTARKTTSLTDKQREQIREFIESDIIPAIEGRDRKLQDVIVPPGAQHLHDLRLQTDELSINAWKNFAMGLTENDTTLLETAETLHKRSLEVDQKVADIIKHTAIAKSIPNIP